jgi:Zn-finger nucleic acid-binding protein
MPAFELDGIEIDRCVECCGTWLDPGELESIAERAGLDPRTFMQSLPQAGGRRHEQKRCPRCARKLRVIHMGPDRSIEVDRCPEGHGFWLDHGEVKAVIASHHGGSEGAVARFLSDLEGQAPSSGELPAQGRKR